MTNARRLTLLAATAAVGSLCGYALAAIRSSRTRPDVLEAESAPEPASTADRRRCSESRGDREDGRSGSPTDRGRTSVYGLDLARLEQLDGFDPVVEHLTYIQSRRGDSSHLLFVRYDDLDQMASLEGNDVAEFLQRLDQLGVVVSNN